jgi:hypothetical protein
LVLTDELDDLRGIGFEGCEHGMLGLERRVRGSSLPARYSPER